MSLKLNASYTVGGADGTFVIQNGVLTVARLQQVNLLDYLTTAQMQYKCTICHLYCSVNMVKVIDLSLKSKVLCSIN